MGWATNHIERLKGHPGLALPDWEQPRGHQWLDRPALDIRAPG